MEGYRIVRCRRCGHRYVADTVTNEVLAAAYERDYYEASDIKDGYENYLGKLGLRTRGFEERLKQIERFSRPPGNMIEIGCAVGIFLKVARDAGWNAMGIERSGWAADFGRKEWGLKIASDLGQEEVKACVPFVVAVMWDVIEHLVSPREMLSQLRSVLRTGAYLAVSTVNASSIGARLAGRQWRHIAPPLHLQYFTRASLKYLLRDFGFEPIFERANGVCLRASKANTRLGIMAGMAEGLMLHWRMRSLAGALNLLDEITIVARLVR